MGDCWQPYIGRVIINCSPLYPYLIRLLFLIMAMTSMFLDLMAVICAGLANQQSNNDIVR